MKKLDRILQGKKLEIECMKQVAQKGVPCLIPQWYCHQNGFGQVDLVYLSRNNIGEGQLHIIEVKSHPVISNEQKRRLKAAQEYLSHFSGLPAVLQLMCPEAEIKNNLSLDGLPFKFNTYNL